jgi:multidrug efflux pump subunit AcrB
VEVSVEDLQFIEQESTKPLKIALLGDDLALLAENAQKIQASLAKLPGLADVTATEGNNQAGEIVEIQRHNGQRAAFISANLQEGKALGDATQEAVAIAQSLLPDDLTLDLGGDSENSSDVLGSFAGTLALSVVLMLLVLILVFGSLIEALVVGLSLPLSIVGAMVALLCTQSEFGIISLIGLILLLGLLDKNALLLMDYAKQLRRGGMERTEAIVNTGLVRLRPILMTTASTILGMVPIALGLGAGAQLRQPMAVAIIGGLLTSTLLSLIVVPVLYTLLEDGWLRLKSL